LFKIHSFYKETYRLPNFTEAYYARLSPTALKPEQAKQFDLGLSFGRLIAKWQLSTRIDVFKIYLKDKIVFIPSQNLFIWSVRNVGKVETTGLDYVLTIENVFSSLKPTFSFGYSYNQSLDKINKESNLYNNQIAYIPTHTGHFSTTVYVHRFSVNFNTNYTGERYFLNENNDQNLLTSFTTFDLTTTYPFHVRKSKILVSAAIKNITNTSYEVVHAFPMPGRVFQLSLKWEL